MTMRPTLPCQAERIDKFGCHRCLWEDVDACALNIHRAASVRPCGSCIRNKQLGAFRDVRPRWDHYRDYDEYMRKIDAFLACPICKEQRRLLNRHGNECTLVCDEHGAFTENITEIKEGK